MRIPRDTFVFTLVLALLALTFGGCEREEEIRTYKAPKDVAPPQHATAPRDAQTSEVPAPLPTTDVPTFTVPTEWKDAGTQSSMRFAAFQVSPDDQTALVTVVPLGPEAGDVLGNVVRWAGQIGMTPPTPEDLAKVTRQLDLGGVPGLWVDLVGPKLRTIAAIVPRAERVWFFKLTGDQRTVGAQERNFDAFVRSIRFENEQDPGASTRPAEAGRAAGAPAWEVPAGWQKLPDRPMRFATFKASADADAPEVVVSRFGAGGFGNMKDNINRWRGMVGLEPVAHEDEQPVQRTEIAGSNAALFDMTGPAKDAQPAKRLLFTMVAAGNDVWFFRMTGSSPAIDKHRTEYDAFLKSLRFGE